MNTTITHSTEGLCIRHTTNQRKLKISTYDVATTTNLCNRFPVSLMMMVSSSDLCRVRCMRARKNRLRMNCNDCYTSFLQASTTRFSTSNPRSIVFRLYYCYYNYCYNLVVVFVVLWIHSFTCHTKSKSHRRVNDVSPFFRYCSWFDYTHQPLFSLRNSNLFLFVNANNDDLLLSGAIDVTDDSNIIINGIAYHPDAVAERQKNKKESSNDAEGNDSNVHVRMLTSDDGNNNNYQQNKNINEANEYQIEHTTNPIDDHVDSIKMDDSVSDTKNSNYHRQRHFHGAIVNKNDFPSTVFEEMWKNVQGQIMKFHHHHHHQQQQQQQQQQQPQQPDKDVQKTNQDHDILIQQEPVSQEPERTIQVNHLPLQELMEKFMDIAVKSIPKRQIRQLSTTSSSGTNENVIKIISRSETADTSTGTASTNLINNNDENNQKEVYVGPGLYTYHRRTSLYQQSVKDHYERQLHNLVLHNTTNFNNHTRVDQTYWNDSIRDFFLLYSTHDSNGRSRRKDVTTDPTTKASSKSNKKKYRQRLRSRQQHNHNDYYSSMKHGLYPPDSRSSTLHTSLLPFPNSRKVHNKQLIRDMFRHGYDSYMYNGYPKGEVKPLSCTPTDFSLIQIDALTLIDSLDSLLVIGNNVTEFARATERLRQYSYNTNTSATTTTTNNNNASSSFDATTGNTATTSPPLLFHIDKNVSVFETNIRVLGGLLSAHQLALAYGLHRKNSKSNNNHNKKQQQTSTASNNNKHYSVLLSDIFNVDGTVRWGGYEGLETTTTYNHSSNEQDTNDDEDDPLIWDQKNQNDDNRHVTIIHKQTDDDDDHDATNQPQTRESDDIKEHIPKDVSSSEQEQQQSLDDNFVSSGSSSSRDKEDVIPELVSDTNNIPEIDIDLFSNLNVMCSIPQEDPFSWSDMCTSSQWKNPLLVSNKNKNNNNNNNNVCSASRNRNKFIENTTRTCTSSDTTCTSSTTTPVSDDTINKDNVLYWRYDGFLLRLAEDIGNRLLPAFTESKTGIPYGTVNLLYGVPTDETSIASVAGGGTLCMEFELLSRLTGNAIYGKVAKLASRAIWIRRSKHPLNLFGKHIDVNTGMWTELLSGIGSNSDSYIEYLAKQYMLFPEDVDFWNMLQSSYQGIMDHSRMGEWYADTDMSTGIHHNGNARKVFESLAAFYPGLQVLLGELTPASRTLNSMFMVREYLGFLPERFNYGVWNLDSIDAGKHPLRPELLESCYLMHRSTRNIIHSSSSADRSRGRQDDSDGGGVGSHKDETSAFTEPTTTTTTTLSSGWQWAADFALHKLNQTTHAKCGYASIHNMSPQTTGTIDPSSSSSSDSSSSNHKNDVSRMLMDEMPSFFLSETLKYLYLTFDDDNESIIHSDVDNEWIFTTEAHPFHYVPIKQKHLQQQRRPKQDQLEKEEVEEEKSCNEEEEVTSTSNNTSTSEPLMDKQSKTRKKLVLYETEIQMLKNILQKRLDLGRVISDTSSNSNRLAGSSYNKHTLKYEKWTEQTSFRAYQKSIDRSKNVLQTFRYRNSGTKQNRHHSEHQQRSTEPLLFAGYQHDQHVHDRLKEVQNHHNIIHLSYTNLGLGIDIYPACINMFSTKYIWIQALNGGSLDYTDMYVSTATDDYSIHPNSFTTIGSSEALGILGTGLYYGETRAGNEHQSCSIVPRTSTTTTSSSSSGGGGSGGGVVRHSAEDVDDLLWSQLLNTNNDAKVSVIGTSSTDSTTSNDEQVGIAKNNNNVFRVTSDLGLFEVSTFPDASGFIVQYLDTNERMVVNFVKDNDDDIAKVPTNSTSSSISSKYKYVMIYSELRTSHEQYDVQSLLKTILNDNRSYNKQRQQQQDDDEDEQLDEDDDSDTERRNNNYNKKRRVVVSDFDGNTFSCKVELILKTISATNTTTTTNDDGDDNNTDATDDDDDVDREHTKNHHWKEVDGGGSVVAEFPCSPAFYGPTTLSNLMKQSIGIQIVDAVIVPPPMEQIDNAHSNPTGCPRKVPSNDNTNNNEDSNTKNNNRFVATDDENHDNDHNNDNNDKNDDNNNDRNKNKIPFLFEYQQNMVSSDCNNRIVPCIPMVRRGECTFYEKSMYSMEHNHADGLIVINDMNEEMFIMSAHNNNNIDDDDNETTVKYDDDTKIPLTVLISYDDGEEIANVIRAVIEYNNNNDNKKGEEEDEEKEKETDEHSTSHRSSSSNKKIVIGRIRIERQVGNVNDDTGKVVNENGDTNPLHIQWPVVRANPDIVMQILAEYGWGIQAVQIIESTPPPPHHHHHQQTTATTIIDNNDKSTASNEKPITWQLQLLKHNIEN